MILMLILSIVISAALDSWKAMGIILFYWLLNLCYCAKLKQYAIIDVCIVAFGFVLRLLAGGVATDIALSKWIVLMTFLITLFMSFAKRRDDVLRMEKTGGATQEYEPLQPYLHQPGHHHHCLGNACVLHHVHGKSGGDRAFQHRASLSHKCLRAGGIAALHTDSCGRPTERRPNPYHAPRPHHTVHHPGLAPLIPDYYIHYIIWRKKKEYIVSTSTEHSPPRTRSWRLSVTKLAHGACCGAFCSTAPSWC